jgi:selenium metabolism protein YedF
MKTIDCRGLNCPEPVLKTKQALEEGAPAGLTIIIDNEGSKNNVERFARSQGCTATATALADGSYEVAITGVPAAAATQDVDPSAFACTPAGDGHLICIVPADSMGRGSDELGWALLQNYVKTLKELSPLPAKIFFYNSGVKIVATDNKAVEAVIEMEQRGVEIWACGTCLEFFHLETELKVGRITNMFDIVNSMAKASHIISPY